MTTDNNPDTFINFTNPTPVSNDEFTDILSLDFGDTTPKTIDNKTKHTEPTKVAEKVEVKEDEDKGEKVVDSVIVLPEDKTGIDIDTKPEEEESTGTIDYANVINTLADKGIITEAYEGFDQEGEVTEETLIKLLEHNVDKAKNEDFEGYIDSLSDTARRVLEFESNQTAKGAEKDKETQSYLRTLLEEQNIKSLDVTNEYDQEKILRQWYKAKEDYNQEEIEEKITDLKTAGLLEKEAKRIKPKLDDEAESIAKKKEVEQKQFKELENRVREDYSNKVLDTLKKGKLSGIDLSKDDAIKLYNVLTQEDLEIKVAGKPTTMSHLEALVLYHKHDPKGSIESLALAAMLLTNRAKFDKEYSKQLETKVTEKFVTQHKYNNNIKTGKEVEGKKQPITNDEAKWRFVLPGAK